MKAEYFQRARTYLHRARYYKHTGKFNVARYLVGLARLFNHMGLREWE